MNIEEIRPVFDILQIKIAFHSVVMGKFMSDGYFDMGYYFNPSGDKASFKLSLSEENSIYQILFENSYLKNANEIVELFDAKFPEEYASRLTKKECSYILIWLFKCFGENKSDITKYLISMSRSDEKLEYMYQICNYESVFYDSEKVNIDHIGKLSQYIDYINGLNSEKEHFYRGHSDVNYVAIPSLMRNDGWLMHEKDMFNKMLLNCPEDFDGGLDAFEKLVIMQHYGLPTRLLDVSMNPLVALYFACRNAKQKFGEVIIFEEDREKIKYPSDEEIVVISKLSSIDYSEQYKLYNEVYFSLKNPDDIKTIEGNGFGSYCVYAPKNNRRIERQQGAFIISGITVSRLFSNEQINDIIIKENGKREVLLIENQETIIDDLKCFGIDEWHLFPEIDKVADSLKNTYEELCVKA